MSKQPLKQRKVLVTGSAGNIGKYFALNHDKSKYKLRLMVHSGIEDKKVDPIRNCGEIVEGTLDNLDRLKELCKGIDTVVHMAGEADPSATWESIRDANINGTYNIFVAAKAAGVKRVIYASSIHAVSGYPKDIQVKVNEPVNPGDIYGVSKCFGEALARYMGEKEGLSSIAIRIGAFQPHESAQNVDSISMMDAWISERDCEHLIECCIDAPDDLKFLIVHGLSRNVFNRLDISDAKNRIGYEPKDNFFDVHPHLKNLKLDEKLAGHNVHDDGQQSGLREQIGKT
ncbi:unnamed protein product [Didymodactylos carnosus]|uniref:NAD-dependent epimerase/dehydratase domain-containing protein n=1 Tax=Didymodactylos carnosus TaxID=1234261 RepID=A0A813Q732_9BILA|nr:unnamed protein product [Didymodactylos carnosus]CAF1032553.1 unnamed protein product [Didymodactylos carnosus]CAF3544007.1 unnamed protein product [Didymodactylos carnosus]CAF3800891.1 unnamed protein product [Didymodactylos carnosus]